jgi:uncharacterized membrane protein YcaP (DUF421 family)
MEFYNEWWGVNEHISPGEIACRSLVMFIICLILIRISGMRPFGKGNAFDNIITFLIGAVLARGIVGATAFIPTAVSGLVLVLIHRVLGELCIKSTAFEELINGKSNILYKDGDFIKRNMDKANITRNDIFEELRLKCHQAQLDEIEEIHIETTGEISFIRKKAGR